MALSAGARLGTYEIIAPLGAGGMGEVYRARDSKLKRDVALKILPDAFARDSDRLARFQREAEALAALNHPNIGAIHGFEETGGVHALVLELIDGETLADRLARSSSGLQLDEALDIALQMTTAIEAAHARGIIHRDLKPANIKVTSEGRVKILDFGLAKAFATQPGATDVSNSPTMVGTVAGSAGVILGTAPYMSPEQARGKPVDARTDIWAFGCVLYEMMTGLPAFTGETITDILGAIVKTEPDWSALPRETPSAVHRLLRRCLAKDPRERLHSIADARLEISETGTERPGTSAAPVATSGRERLAWALATLALLGAAVSGVPAVQYWRTSRTPPGDAPEMRLEVNTRATTDPLSFALSPDGRRLVFAGSEGGTARLWLRPLDAMTARPLAGTEGGSFPFWSPDSRSIGFFTGNKLKRIDVDSGFLQDVANISGGRGGAWSRDDIIVFGQGQGQGLFRVPAFGGDVTAATQIAARQIGHRFPFFLPDGRRFVYFVQAPGDFQGVYVGALDSPNSTRLLASDTAAAFVGPGYLLYVRQGTLVAQRIDVEKNVATESPITVAAVGGDATLGLGGFSVSATGMIAHRTGGPGRRQFTWFDRTGRTLDTLGDLDDAGPNYPNLSPDGKRVAFDRQISNNRDIWIGDVARGALTRFTSDAAIDATPVWSSDGNTVIFRSLRSGSVDLFQKPATRDGAESVLLESGAAKVPCDSSHDGRFLLFSASDPTTRYDLWVMPMFGDRKPFPYVRTAFDERQAQFSPDDRLVAYQSDESGQLEVYVRPFPGPGRAEKVSIAGGASPRWRADGRELYYLSSDGKVIAVPIGAQGSAVVPGTPTTLFQSRVAGGSWGAAAGNLLPQYDVASDGRFLMNVTAEETVSPITIILNWKPPSGHPPSSAGRP